MEKQFSVSPSPDSTAVLWDGDGFSHPSSSSHQKSSAAGGYQSLDPFLIGALRSISSMEKLRSARGSKLLAFFFSPEALSEARTHLISSLCLCSVREKSLRLILSEHDPGMPNRC